MNEERTLLVTDNQGQFKITIPADWKVTFGTAGGNRNGYDDRELRIYESDKKQRACFTGVRSFRDLSLPLFRLIESESGEMTWEDDGEGNRLAKKATKRNRKAVKEEW